MIILRKVAVSTTDDVINFPLYFVASDVHINITSWRQYVITEIGYIDIEGIIEVDEGSAVIIQGAS